jgi:hypothetical protein
MSRKVFKVSTNRSMSTGGIGVPVDDLVYSLELS